MPILPLGQLSLYYIQAGSGPDVVLTHGLASSLAFWYLRVFPALTRHYRVTLYDLRGHGHSSMPPTGYTSAGMAEDLGRLLDALRIDTAHLIAHSYGGLVALEYATANPDRVASLTIADSRIPSLQPQVKLQDWPYWPVWRKTLLIWGVPLPPPDSDVDFHLLEAIASAGAGRPGTLIASPLGHLAAWRRNRRATEQWLRLLRTTTAREEFRSTCGPSLEKIQELECPILAIFGEYSHCLPTCHRLAEISADCHVIVLPRVGHFHPTVRPGPFVHHLRTFLLQQERERVPG